MSIDILIVDDHQLFREGLRVLIEKEEGMNVVAEADNGGDAVDMVKELAPDLVIMDVAMPDMGGIDAAGEIKEFSPETCIIALSMHSDKRYIKGMLKAGASGYLLKDNAFDEVIDCIKRVTEGKVHLCPVITDILARDVATAGANGDRSGKTGLSPREEEILKLIAGGKVTKQIAAELDVSTKTVETHRRRLMSKLKLFTVADLTRYAISEGLITLDG